MQKYIKYPKKAPLLLKIKSGKKIELNIKK